MEVNRQDHSISFSGSTSGRVVSCSQVFYYFQHYSQNDNFGTKFIVCHRILSPVVGFLFQIHRLLLP